MQPPKNPILALSPLRELTARPHARRRVPGEPHHDRRWGPRHRRQRPRGREGEGGDGAARGGGEWSRRADARGG